MEIFICLLEFPYLYRELSVQQLVKLHQLKITDTWFRV